MSILSNKLKKVVDNIKNTPHNEMAKRLQKAENTTFAKNVNKLNLSRTHYE